MTLWVPMRSNVVAGILMSDQFSQCWAVIFGYGKKSNESGWVEGAVIVTRIDSAKGNLEPVLNAHRLDILSAPNLVKVNHQSPQCTYNFEVRIGKEFRFGELIYVLHITTYSPYVHYRVSSWLNAKFLCLQLREGII